MNKEIVEEKFHFFVRYSIFILIGIFIISIFIRLFYLQVNTLLSLDALFYFWPEYEDGTMPDLVIVVGDYYLLFEAKYYSGFGRATKSSQSQLIREMIGGIAEAQYLGKQFFFGSDNSRLCL